MRAPVIRKSVSHPERRPHLADHDAERRHFVGCDPAVPLRDQVDLDSMNWLDFLVVLNAKLGVDILAADSRRRR